MKGVPITRPLRFNETSTYYLPIEILGSRFIKSQWSVSRYSLTRPLRFNEAEYLLPAHWDLMKRVPITRPLRFNEASTYYPPIEI